MGNQDIREMHKLLFEECVWLRTCYNNFNMLFWSGTYIEELLRKSAAIFFDDINRMYVEYFIVLVARITDPAKSLGKDNLTIYSLNEALEQEGVMTPEIKDLVVSIGLYRNRILDARNKLVSHMDKNAFLCGGSLGGHAGPELEQFFDDIQTYMNLSGDLVGNGPSDFSVTSRKGDVLDLIKVLEKGV